MHTQLHSVPSTLLQAITDSGHMPETPGHSQASVGQSLVGSLLPSPGTWCTQGCLCPQRVCFLALCKFWQLCGGVDGDLLQEGLCHNSGLLHLDFCPSSSPLLTHTSAGDTQTVYCLSLCGVSGSWCVQGLSECLWQVWDLILNAILPLLRLSGASPLSLNLGNLLKVT